MGSGCRRFSSPWVGHTAQDSSLESTYPQGLKAWGCFGSRAAWLKPSHDTKHRSLSFFISLGGPQAGPSTGVEQAVTVFGQV